MQSHQSANYLSILGMAAWEPEKVRAALREFIAERKLTVNGWTKKSKLRESTLRIFLAGASDSLTLRSLVKLADGANVELAELLLQSEAQRTAARLATRLVGANLDAWLNHGNLLAPAEVVTVKEEPPQKATLKNTKRPARPFTGVSSSRSRQVG